MAMPDIIDPLNILKEDLADDSVEIQLEAIKALSTVAMAMGPERVCGELFKALESYCFPVEIQAAMSPEAYSNTDALAAKEEVLAAIAEHLTPDFIEYCGGSSKAAKAMLPLLHKLCMVEETVIRNNAVEALSNIIRKLEAADVQKHALPILEALSGDEWFTSKCSASGLSAPLYRMLASPDSRKKVLDIHQKLCTDDMPMVKSDAYKNLVPLLDSLDDVSLATDFVSPLLESLSKELIESMRQSIVDIVAKLAERAHSLTYPDAKADDGDEKSSAADKDSEVIAGAGDGAKITGGIRGDAQTLTMHFLQFAVDDDSWRVRKYCAQKIATVAYYIKPSVVSSDVRQLYVKLLTDTEPQVRKAAISSLEKVLACSEGETFATALAGKTGPISSLVSDSVAEVRESLAENIAYLGEHLSATAISEVFLPSLKKLASDDSPLARLNLCSKLSIICKILGIDKFSSDILPLLKEVTIDQRWRVRNSVVQNLADIGVQMGSSKFAESRLKDILVQSLKDPAATVRDTACEQVRKLHKEFGHEWMTANFFEQMVSIYKDSGNYLHRMVPLKAIKLMAPELTGAQIRTDFATLLLQALKDPISNVRFTACRVLIVVLPKVDSTISEKFTTLLKTLASSDEDEDVVYFAQEALRVAR